MSIGAGPPTRRAPWKAQPTSLCKVKTGSRDTCFPAGLTSDLLVSSGSPAAPFSTPFSVLDTTDTLALSGSRRWLSSGAPSPAFSAREVLPGRREPGVLTLWDDVTHNAPRGPHL